MPTTTSPLSNASLHQGPDCGGLWLTDALSSQRYVLAPGSNTIGAGPKCDLRLDGPGLRPLHCVIVWNETGATVRRWSAGTSLNGQSFTESPLQDGDRLSVGPLDLVVSTGAEIAEKELEAHEPGLLEQEIVDCIDGLEVLAEESIHESPEPPAAVEDEAELTAEIVSSDEASRELPLEPPSEGADRHFNQDLAADAIHSVCESEGSSIESAVAIHPNTPQLLETCQPSYGYFAEPQTELESELDQEPETEQELETGIDQEPQGPLEAPALEAPAPLEDHPIAGLLTYRDRAYQLEAVKLETVELETEELETLELEIEEPNPWQADGCRDIPQLSDESDTNDDYEYYTDVNWEAVAETAEAAYADSHQTPFAIAESVSLAGEETAQAFDSTRSRARRLIRSLREERDAAAEVRYELCMVRGERDVLSSRVAVLQDELDERDEALDQLKNEHRATASELAALREDQASLDSMCLELRDQVQQLAETMDELASAKAEWESERQQLSLELELAREELAQQELARQRDPAPLHEVTSDDSGQFALAPSDPEGRKVTEWATTEPEDAEEFRPELQAVSELPAPSGEPSSNGESDSIESEEACDDAATPVSSEPVADDLVRSESTVERTEAAPMADLWDLERAQLASAELADEPAPEHSAPEVSNEGPAPLEEPAAAATSRREYYVAEDVLADTLEPADDSDVGCTDRESVQEPIAIEPSDESVSDECEQAISKTEFALESALGEPEGQSESSAPFEAPKSFYEQYAHLLPSDDEPASSESMLVHQPSAPVSVPMLVPTPEPALASQSGDNEEEDIEAYMAQLMQRMRGESVEPKPAPQHEKANAADQAVEKTETPLASAAQSPPEKPLISLDELKRTAAPEHLTDMNSLRMLANESARQAIGVAASKQGKEQSIANLIIAAIAMGIGGYLVASAPGVMSTQLVGGAFALLLAGVWVYRSVTHLLQAVRSGAFDHSSAKADDALPIA